jgi:hypothetical protein
LIPRSEVPETFGRLAGALVFVEQDEIVVLDDQPRAEIAVTQRIAVVVLDQLLAVDRAARARFGQQRAHQVLDAFLSPLAKLIRSEVHQLAVLGTGT